MKEFKTPECEMIALEETDVITTSGGNGCLRQNESGGVCDLGIS